MKAAAHIFPTLLLVLPSLIAVRGARADTSVVVWNAPGGDVAASPDYEVTLRRADRTWKPFTYYSYNRPCDKQLDPEGKYIKLSFLSLHSNEYRPPSESRDTYAHSWTSFDFSGGPVDVEIRIRRPLDGLTLPLRSCRVLPSSLGITAEVAGPDVIRFTLQKPAKVAVVPNAEQAIEKLGQAETKQAFEGYRNPLFVFARAPETDAPDPHAPGTLVVRPGQPCSVPELAAAKLVYFEPGVHDFSRFNPADPDHYITLHEGQTVYLAGGSYVYGVVSAGTPRPAVRDMPLIRGRGTLSGLRQRWTDLPYRTTVERGVRMEGIQITDPQNHISHSWSPVRDIAVVGAWHGNTDGITREVPSREPYAGWHVDDCFVMAADSNLKVGGCARVRNYTAWQLNNAEPFWIRNPDGCTVDGLQIIAYHSPVNRQTINISRGTARHSVFRNITIEAPFLPLVFLMPVSEGTEEPVYENVLFENVTVNSPFIARKSPFGSAGGNVRLGRVVFRNLVINGVRVTAENCRDYFDLRPGATVGRDIVFE